MLIIDIFMLIYKQIFTYVCAISAYILFERLGFDRNLMENATVKYICERLEPQNLKEYLSTYVEFEDDGKKK